ncbi:hypothetical protein Pelo_17843 [Pelomyxa schiedti]|nr:hypothetical protein Pelo_17843 [Pelomyxa schiedti]
MILVPTDPYTFDSLVGPSPLLSSLDIAFVSAEKIANTSDSIWLTVKDGNRSLGQACPAQVSSGASAFIPLGCIDAIVNCPLLFQLVTGKEAAYFDPSRIDFL